MIPTRSRELGEAFISLADDGMIRLRWKADPGYGSDDRDRHCEGGGAAAPRRQQSTSNTNLDAFVEILPAGGARDDNAVDLPSVYRQYDFGGLLRQDLATTPNQALRRRHEARHDLALGGVWM